MNQTICIVIYDLISLSSLRSKQSQVAQRVAILEKRLRQIEEAGNRG